VTTLSGRAGPDDEDPRLATVTGLAERCAPAVVVACGAEVDLTNVARLREALLTAHSANPTVVVDMSGTVFCDSSAVRVLVQAHELAAASGGELWMVVTSPALMRIFTVTGVDRLFRIFASLAEALQAAPELAAESGVCRAGNLSA
jgi:anti-sigma B factor antagonist